MVSSQDTRSINDCQLQELIRNQESTCSEPSDDCDNWCKLTDTDGEEAVQVTLQPHNNHFDRVISNNPWLWHAPQEDEDCYESWPPIFSLDEEKGDDWTFADLDEEIQTKLWQKKVQSLTLREARQQLPLLSLAVRKETGGMVIGSVGPYIPLFQGTNGDEYHFNASGSEVLTNVYCPGRLEGTSRNADVYYQLTPRIISNTPLSLPLPKVAYTLGLLNVRTKAPNGRYVLHITDYEVVVDVGHRDLPVWIVSSRQTLSTRGSHARDLPGWAAYPICDGLMVTADGGHDAACILPSLRDWASTPPEKRVELYTSACELIRETRATVDPVRTILHSKEVEERFKGEPDSWPIRPDPTTYLEWLRHGVVRVWESLTQRS